MTGAVDALSDRVLHGMLTESPDLALVLGLRAVGGQPLPEAGLPDFSEAGAERRAAMVRGWAQALHAIPASQDSPAEGVTRAVLGYVLETGFFNRFFGVAGQAFGDQIEPLTHLSGAHATAMQMLTRDHEFSVPHSGDVWIERLSRLPAAIDDAATTLSARRRRGLVAPRPILVRAIADITAAMAADPQSHAFHSALARGLADKPVEQRDRLLAAADRLLTGDVTAAYGRLVEELERHRAASDEAISVLRRPGGAGFYAWRLAGHTTSDTGPQRAHAIGVWEIARLGEALRTEFAALGVGGSRGDAFRAIARQDAYPDGDAGRALALTDAREQVERAHAAMRPLFNLWPAADVTVKPYALADEASQHTSYVPPAHDGAPATFWLNLAQAVAGSRSEAAVTAWHETWPGHHLQLSLARTLPLPEFRRCMLFAAYLEGWAKYSEALPEVVGLASSPYARVARLRMELYSTTTLVMDTAVHTMGWSLEDAAAFFERETGAGKALAAMVALRSAADPGHLCAYKVGLLKVRDLRERFEAARGAAFRVQDFHDAVLDQGALPLSVLDNLVAQRAREAA